MHVENLKHTHPPLEIVESEKQGLLLTLAGQEEEIRSHGPSFCYTNMSQHKPMRRQLSAERKDTAETKRIH